MPPGRDVNRLVLKCSGEEGLAAMSHCSPLAGSDAIWSLQVGQGAEHSSQAEERCPAALGHRASKRRDRNHSAKLQ